MERKNARIDQLQSFLIDGSPRNEENRAAFENVDWKLYENNNLIELVDKSLDPEEYNPEEIKRIMEIALLCTQSAVPSRPTMSEVVVTREAERVTGSLTSNEDHRIALTGSWEWYDRMCVGLDIDHPTLADPEVAKAGTKRKLGTRPPRCTLRAHDHLHAGA
ncbi:hypothetical protein ABZP36_010790 [Zizania latifolia]